MSLSGTRPARVIDGMTNSNTIAATVPHVTLHDIYVVEPGVIDPATGEDAEFVLPAGTRVRVVESWWVPNYPDDGDGSVRKRLEITTDGGVTWRRVETYEHVVTGTTEPPGGDKESER